jgi:hypothetical protein
MHDDKSPDDIEPAAIGLGILFAIVLIAVVIRLL